MIILICSFCSKPQTEVYLLIESPDKNAHICDRCVDVCVQMVADYASKNNCPAWDRPGDQIEDWQINGPLDKVIATDTRLDEAIDLVEEMTE